MFDFVVVDGAVITIQLSLTTSTLIIVKIFFMNFNLFVSLLISYNNDTTNNYNNNTENNDYNNFNDNNYSNQTDSFQYETNNDGGGYDYSSGADGGYSGGGNRNYLISISEFD